MIMISLKLVRLSLQIYTIGDKFEIVLSGNVCTLLIDYDFTSTCIFEIKSAMMTKNIHIKAAIADTDGSMPCRQLTGGSSICHTTSSTQQ
jgi:hypothetical protein